MRMARLPLMGSCGCQFYAATAGLINRVLKPWPSPRVRSKIRRIAESVVILSVLEEKTSLASSSAGHAEAFHVGCLALVEAERSCPEGNDLKKAASNGDVLQEMDGLIDVGEIAMEEDRGNDTEHRHRGRRDPDLKADKKQK